MTHSVKNHIPGFTSHTAHLNGVKVHYWIGGDPEGEPVLLWHGFLGTSHSWRKVMPLLADGGFAVLVPDMRGYGDSDKPQGIAGYDALALCEEFRALVKQLGFGKNKPVSLAAHDMGAAPALIWSALYPAEVKSLLYIEMVVMLAEILEPHLSFTKEVMQSPVGPMWWWILPHAPKVAETLIVGKEAEFLNWFYQGVSADPSAIELSAIHEVLRTFSGKEGVLGALGIYRAVFTSMEQTKPLMVHKVKTPVIAMGGASCLGSAVAQMLSLVAADIKTVVVEHSGHFIPEEQPQAVVDQIIALR